jgi:hypothetical protein
MDYNSLKYRPIYRLCHKIVSLIYAKFTYIFIDESICEEIGLATLTSLFIPQRKIKRITKDFYVVIKEIIDKFPNTTKEGSKVVYSTPILHANSLLQNSKENAALDFTEINDEFRIHIMSKILDIVIKHRLHIVRLGYNNYNEIQKANFKDDKMYSTNWLGLSSYIDRYCWAKNVICVMDGNNMKMIRTLSGFISSAKNLSYLYPEFDKSSIFIDSRRFIGNVFYVPARYCEFLQIVDIISFVLHKKDFIDKKNVRTEFTSSIYNLHEKLDNKRVTNSVISLSIRE